MKEKIRKYFQIFQDSNLTWGKGKDNYVSAGAILVGLIFSPIAGVISLFVLLVSPIAIWLSKD